ncbi:hypothetical protein [Ferrimicrobium sp.]|uniref:hypothetical protein n=1 Tax=Ferrimicrobium sp. TaxID=2926050 RepID=UPI00261F09C4|nr:hypothetical protein [Ferrimicrobium sp.]
MIKGTSFAKSTPKLIATAGNGALSAAADCASWCLSVTRRRCESSFGVQELQIMRIVLGSSVEGAASTHYQPATLSSWSGGECALVRRFWLY